MLRASPLASRRAKLVGCVTFLCMTLLWLSAYLGQTSELYDIDIESPDHQVLRELTEIRRQYQNSQKPSTVGLVMGKREGEDVRWVLNYCKEHENVPFVYTTELAPQKQLLIPRITRGREVAAYLSYVVDFYDHLPKYSMFIHAAHDQPHNDLFGPETASVLSNLRLQSVDAHGFVNLRCSHQPGCQASVHPTSPTQTDIGRKDIRAYFAQAYQELFDIPLGEVPAHIGNICCCQFAVSRERIRARPRGDYERMLDWAADTNLTNDYGVGWVFEKVWHIVFLMEPTHCPPYEQCRCDNYGWCGPLASEETLHAVTSSRGPFGIW